MSVDHYGALSMSYAQGHVTWVLRWGRNTQNSMKYSVCQYFVTFIVSSRHPWALEVLGGYCHRALLLAVLNGCYTRGRDVHVHGRSSRDFQLCVRGRMKACRWLELRLQMARERLDERARRRPESGRGVPSPLQGRFFRVEMKRQPSPVLPTRRPRPEPNGQLRNGALVCCLFASLSPRRLFGGEQRVHRMHHRRIEANSSGGIHRINALQGYEH